MKKLIVSFLILFFSIGVQASIEDFQFTNQVYQESSKPLKYTIHVRVPQFQDKENNSLRRLNHLIELLIHQQVESFKKDAQDFAKDDNTPADSSSSLNISYEVYSIPHQSIISLRFVINTYFAGTPHPNLMHRVLNYDLNQNKVILLSSLFKAHSDYERVLNDYVSMHLSKKLDLPTSEIIPLLSFSNWNIQERGLLFTFDDFPHAVGPQEILVPYHRLQQVIIPNGLLEPIKDNLH